MKALLSLLVLCSALLLGHGGYAAGQATPDEAKAFAIKAAEYLKANGPEKAFAAFDEKTGRWHDRDLYITVQDSKGVMLAHGTNPGLVGKSLIDLKDVDGKAFTREMIAVQDSGWVDFKWQNPITKAVEPKRQYIIRVGDYLIGVGAYVK
jgi:cytochrome c